MLDPDFIKAKERSTAIEACGCLCRYVSLEGFFGWTAMAKWVAADSAFAGSDLQ